MKSVLQQSFVDFEVIVIDDGSKDDTLSVVHQIGDQRVKYQYQQNSERGAARNAGVAIAQGKYVTFLDSDDKFLIHHLFEAHRFILQNQPVVFCQGYEIRGEDGKVLSRSKYNGEPVNHSLLYGNHLSCMGVFMVKDLASSFRFIEDRAFSGSEDWELWVRIACHHDILSNPVITSYMEQHDGRSVLSFETEKLRKRIEIVLQYITSQEAFQIKFPRGASILRSHGYLYLSLHLALMQNRRDSLKYLKKALTLHMDIHSVRKIAGILKNLVK